MTASALSPILAVHITAALSAVVLGPFAIWARLGKKSHPQWHKALGYAWVALMVITASSALFLKSTVTHLPKWGNYSPIHLLIFLTYGSLIRAFIHLKRGNIQKHKKTMLWLYFSACLVTGAFTLLPGRFMHHIVFNT